MSESMERLLNSNITVILVKGLPGTGKTTLTFELLYKHGRGVYVSTRVSKDKLDKQYPHLKSLIEEGGLIEAAPGRAVRFEDLRFGRAVDIAEFVLKAIKELKEPLIILDSWDALAKELGYKERLAVEKSLVGIAEANGARIVFVSEEPELTTTDYLADAIVTLKDEEIEGRRIRRIEWNKLRGTEISQKNYLFTLHEGRFTMFKAISPERPAEIKAARFKRVEQPEPYYSTGSRDLDRIMGGMKKGSTILLEVGTGVGGELYHPLIHSIGLNFLFQGGSFLTMPSETILPQSIKKNLSEYLPKEMVERGLRIGIYEEPSDPCFFKLDPGSVENSLETVFRETETLKTPRIYFVDANTLELLHGVKDTLGFLLRLSRKTRLDEDVLTMLVKRSTKGMEDLSALSDNHVKLDIIDGALILYSIKPAWQTVYHLDYDYLKGYPVARITPVV